MAIITKAIAEDVAKKLLEDRDKKIEDLYSNFRKKIVTIHLRSIPQKIVELFKTHKNFINETSYLDIQGTGWTFTRVHLAGTFPCSNNSRYLEATDEELKSLLVEYNEISTEKEERRTIYLELVSTLAAIRTYKKASEIFPECIKFLPKIVNAKIIVSVDDLRSKIPLEKIKSS